MKKLLLPILLFLMFGPFIVNAESKYLYDEIKNKAEENNVSQDVIYYYKGPNANNHVIFGDYCWQIIRTTDSGGIKLLYDGTPSNNKCTKNRINFPSINNISNLTIDNTIVFSDSYLYDNTTGTFKLTGNTYKSDKFDNNLLNKFTCKKEDIDETCNTLYYIVSINDASTSKVAILKNSNYPAIAYQSANQVAYTYNTSINSQSFSKPSQPQKVYKAVSKTSNFYYANSYTFSGKYYSLSNPVLYTNSNSEDLIGKYTFFSSYESDKSSSFPYKIYEVTDDSNLIIGVEYPYQNYENIELIFGKDVVSIDSGYKLIDVKKYNLEEFCLHEDNMIGYYHCKDLTKDECVYSNLYNINGSGGDSICNNGISSYNGGVQYYGKDVSWDGTNYSLVDTILMTKLKNDSIKNEYRYTCNSVNKNCNKVYYRFNNTHTTLENGQKFEDLIDTTFNNLGSNDSNLKKYIDLWYEMNLIKYSNFIEDTVYCNNKKFDIKELFGNYAANIIFDNSITDFRCSRNVDKYSVSSLNGNGGLKYPIATITYDEIKASLNESGTYINNKGDLWSMTPNTYKTNFYFAENGEIKDTGVTTKKYIRPVISLKKDITFIEGDGTEEKPYIADKLISKYSIDVEIKNETEDININIEDLTQVEAGEEVNFKVTPIKGYQVNTITIIDKENNEIEYTTTDNKNYTFTMPETDVTIIPSYEKVKNAVNVEDNKNTKEIKIEVNDATAIVYEDTVKFKVEPQDGYEVESIEMIDKNNNKINYRKTNNKNEYEFTMPDTDVLIKPKYRKIESINVLDTLRNPNTGTGISIIIIFMLIISSITYIIFKRKKNYIMK